MIVNSLAVGKARRSAGNLTFTTDAAGRTIAKQKATVVRNPKSEGQTFNRTRLKLVSVFFASINAILTSAWTRTKANVAAYSEAVGLALTNAAWTTDQVVEFCKARIEVGKGRLEAFSEFVVGAIDFKSATGELLVQCNYKATAFGNGLSSDTVRLVCYNMTDGKVEAVSDPANRADANVTLLVSNIVESKNYVVFPIFKALNGSLTGDAAFIAYLVNGGTGLTV